jgi:hypothetical protein
MYGETSELSPIDRASPSRVAVAAHDRLAQGGVTDGEGLLPAWRLRALAAAQ